MPPTYFPLRWESTGDLWWYASPIDWAAANGHYDLVRELLRLDGNHLIKLASLRRIRRLETVWDDEEQFDDVAKYRCQVARKLLSECESTRGKKSLIGAGYGGWLLYTAASAGDLCFVQELLQRDPLLVFGEGEYGVTDIFYAAARSKNSEVFRVIFDFAISPRFLTGNGEELEEHIGDIPSAYKQEMKNRALHAAARGGNLKMLKDLLGDCPDVLTYRDIHGSTILHAAAGRGQVEVVKDLVTCYNIIDSADKQGNTALHLAAYRGHLSVVEALIQASPVSIYTKNNVGGTFLHMAVTGFQTPTFQRLDRQVDLMKQLVYSKTLNIEQIINVKDNDGRTPLHLAIIGNIHSDLVELLMTVGSINVNIRDTSGMTPLDLLRQRPRSASSELLTRQLVSAGAISSCQDLSARQMIASHLRMRSMGSSPGTSFNISDTEIFLYTGMENAIDTTGPAVPSNYSAKLSQVESTVQDCSPKKNNKHKGIKRLLHWPKSKDKKLERLKKTADALTSGGIPVTLRERYSKPSSLPNNKRTLAVRSNLPSPTAKKKLAFGLVDGVMQAMPHLHIPRRSRSSSFSKASISSHNSSHSRQVSISAENDIVGSNQGLDNGVSNLSQEQGTSSNKRLMNQYFCFGAASASAMKSSADCQQPHEIYDRYVLSMA